MIIIVAQRVVTMEMTITEIDRGRKMVLENGSRLLLIIKIVEHVYSALWIRCIFFLPLLFLFLCLQFIWFSILSIFSMCLSDFFYRSIYFVYLFICYFIHLFIIYCLLSFLFVYVLTSSKKIIHLISVFYICILHFLLLHFYCYFPLSLSVGTSRKRHTSLWEDTVNKLYFNVQFINSVAPSCHTWF